MVKMRFETVKGPFEGALDESPIARALVQQLPITSTVMRWGDEIYFDVPVRMANTQPTRDVRVGDIAYWPDGPCLCVFFGKTPASNANEPRPASDVTVIGHTDATVERLRAIAEGTRMTVERAIPAEASAPASRPWPARTRPTS